MSKLTTALLESGAAPMRRWARASDASLFGNSGEFYRLRPTSPAECRAVPFDSRYCLVVQAQPGKYFPHPLPYEGDELDLAIIAMASEPSAAAREPALAALLDLISHGPRPTVEAWRALTRERLGICDYGDEDDTGG